MATRTVHELADQLDLGVADAKLSCSPPETPNQLHSSMGCTVHWNVSGGKWHCRHHRGGWELDLRAHRRLPSRRRPPPLPPRPVDARVVRAFQPPAMPAHARASLSMPAQGRCTPASWSSAGLPSGFPTVAAAGGRHRDAVLLLSPSLRRPAYR
uniref:Uncharacterized protein n=1 Tax=Oryza glumipatula TaxID=40148 RepID=A0A0E0BQ15_9ORYZ